MIEYFPFPILELEYVDICYTISLTKVSYHAKQNQRKSQREREREKQFNQNSPACAGTFNCGGNGWHGKFVGAIGVSEGSGATAVEWW